MNQATKSFAAAVAVLLAVPAFAQDNVGQCGWGSKVFDGDNGLAPQVLAVTTNGLFGNQTFGMTSGTSGCTRNGVVRSNWKTAMFIEENRENLAADMSRGRGESLDTLAGLMGMEGSDKEAFFTIARSNFGSIFGNPEVTTKDVVASLRETLKADAVLAKYASAV
jgi:hypothetical protein